MTVVVLVGASRTSGDTVLESGQHGPSSVGDRGIFAAADRGRCNRHRQDSVRGAARVRRFELGDRLRLVMMIMVVVVIVAVVVKTRRLFFLACQLVDFPRTDLLAHESERGHVGFAEVPFEKSKRPSLGHSLLLGVSGILSALLVCQRVDYWVNEAVHVADPRYDALDDESERPFGKGAI